MVPGAGVRTLDAGVSPDEARGASADDTTGAPQSARHWPRADLMRRAFDIDVLACPRCGNRMRLLATIEDPQIVEQILTHLGLLSEPVRADPAHSPPAYSAPTLFAVTPA